MIGISLSGLRTGLLGGVALAAMLVAAPYQAGARVGVTSQTSNNPLGTPPAQAQRTLKIGVDVFADERIQTTANDRAHLLFLDGSSLTVGPNSDLRIDKFVYDPATRTGDLAISATKGVFRLVGGRITKTGQATIKGLTSTIGIRGGIAIVNAPEGQPVQAYFMFGEQMTVNTPEGQQQATRPGSLITSTTGEAPAEPVLAPPNSLAGPIAELEASTTGTEQATSTGDGAGQSSTGQQSAAAQPAPAQVEQQVASSEIPATNSGGEPTALAPPASASGGGESSSSTASPAQTANDTTGAGNATGSAPETTQPPPTPPAPPPVITISAEGRYFRSPEILNFNPANVAADRDPANNVTLQSASLSGSELTVTSASGSTFTVPWLETGTNFSITGNNSTSSIGPIEGTGFVSPNGDFYFYDLRETSNANNKVGFFGGVPTPSTGLPTTGIAARQIIQTPGTVPYLPDSLAGQAPFVGADHGLMLIAYSPNIDFQQPIDAQRSLWMQATLNIEGQGAGQSSFMTLANGVFWLDESAEGSPAMGGRVQTIARLSSSSHTIRYAASAGAVETETGSAIYGPNAEYLVIYPEGVTNTTGTSTTHTPQGAFVQTHGATGGGFFDVTAVGPAPLPAGVGVTRTAETLNGYAAGLIEIYDANTDSFFTRSMVSGAPNELVMGKAPAANRAAGGFLIRDVDDPSQNMILRWGSLSGPNAADSTMIDDKHFSMHQSPTNPSTYNDGNNFIARIDLVTQAAVPDADWLPNGVAFCECQYLTWGYWQGEMRFNEGPNAGQWGRAHLGTWVSGNLAADIDLPLSGTATYNGHIIGNVESGANKYIAAGNFSNAWNFGTRTGTVDITNFDGANYTGTTTGSPGNVNFSGSFAGAGRTGALNGSIFRSPTDAAAYQAGSFNINGPAYKAVGTFAAQR